MFFVWQKSLLKQKACFPDRKEVSAIIFTVAPKTKTASGNKKAVFVLLLFYVSLVLYYTVFMRPADFYGAQFELSWSYKKWLTGDWEIGRQILGNIAMFVPFGFLLSALVPYRKKACLAVVIAGFVFSCIIETFQLELMRGLFEYDDIVNNTLGALLGLLLYKVTGKPEAQERNEKVVLFLGTLFVAVGLLLCFYNGVYDAGADGMKKNNAPRAICFQVDKAVLEGNRLLLDGFAFGCEQALPDFNLTLKSVKTGTELKSDMEYGLVRQDVAGYFNGTNDYAKTGFKAAVSGIQANEEYEICMDFGWRALLPAGVYIVGTRIHYAKKSDFIPPDVAGTDLEEIVKNGYLRVYRPDRSCYVYQYKGHLYWIADKTFDFESDGTTYIQYQLWTTQQEKLPQKRLQNQWYWDNIGGYFEKYEITDHLNCGRYRVCKRKLPEQYAVTSVVTGYYKWGKWIWRSYFRPVYEFGSK